MEVRPILSALWRNKTGAILVACQVAVTLAVVVNAAFIIDQRLEKMNRPTGMDIDNIFIIKSQGFASGYNYEQQVQEDLRALRAMPGVVDAMLLNGIPLSGGGSANTFYPGPKDRSRDMTAGIYLMDDHGPNTLGLKLVAGRNFTAEEIDFDRDDGKYPTRAMLSQAAADEFFPDGDALGNTFYTGLGEPVTVVGIVERMHGAWVNWDGLERVVLLPQFPIEQWSNYVIRAEPGQRDVLMPLVEQKLAELSDGRVLSTLRTHSEIVARSYRDDRTMTVLLVTVIALLLAVTSLGVVGLASFNVRTRTKQIGTRRAIGARRIDILRYFLVENWLITGIGLLLGVVLTYVFDYWLVTTYNLPRLEPGYLLAGIAALWLLGQIATLAPARRAAAIPPAIATRTV